MKISQKFLRQVYDKAHIVRFYLHKRKAYLTLAKRMQQNIPIDESLFSRNIVAEYQKKWKQLDPFPSSLFFKLYSSFRNEVDIDYIPDYLYSFPVDLILSNLRYAIYTENKSIYEKRMPEYNDLFPKSIAFKINGVFYDENYRYIENIEQFIDKINLGELIAKESIDSGSGRGVALYIRDIETGSFKNKLGKPLSVALNEHTDLVLQEKVAQCEFMRSFNESSINTFRVVTYRSVKTNEVHIMQSLLRRGPKDSFLDNLHAGGNLIAITKEGLLAEFGIDENGKKISSEMGCMKVPYLDKVHEIAKDIASKDYFNRQLFFDFFIDDQERVRIMEINLTSFPTIHLYCGPAFGEFTDEVIAY